MFAYRVMKRREDDFLAVLLLLVIALLPALPAFALWTWLDPAGFWQRFLFVAVYALFIYPSLLAIEIFVFKLYD